MKWAEQMENRKKRYQVISIIDGSELYVDSFDLLDQACLCVLRIQDAYHSAPQEKFIRYPRLVIRDTKSESAPHTTRDRLSQMAQIEAANDRRIQEWSARHEAAPRS